jgi:hypothetical protein
MWVLLWASLTSDLSLAVLPASRPFCLVGSVEPTSAQPFLIQRSLPHVIPTRSMGRRVVNPYCTKGRCP